MRTLYYGVRGVVSRSLVADTRPSQMESHDQNDSAYRWQHMRMRSIMRLPSTRAHGTGRRDRQARLVPSTNLSSLRAAPWGKRTVRMRLREMRGLKMPVTVPWRTPGTGGGQRRGRVRPMTREEARKEAHRRWGDNDTTPGFHYGVVVLRQKNNRNALKLATRFVAVRRITVFMCRAAVAFVDGAIRGKRHSQMPMRTRRVRSLRSSRYLETRDRR